MSSPIIAGLPNGYRIDRHYGLVYDHVPPMSDDLTLIHGINTREAVALNRLGIYLHGQIALWQHHEVAVFAEELRTSPAAIQESGWVEHAGRLARQVAPMPQRNELPASILRTVSFLICSLLIGFFVVYMLRRDVSPALRGVLSADITSLRVPMDSTLVEAHVRAGDEVFSGEKLLTLEKIEHLELIEKQKSKVQLLQLQLQQAEARAALELETRTRETEAALCLAREELNQHLRISQPHMTAENESGVRNVSASRNLTQPAKAHVAANRRAPGQLLFFAGASGDSGLPPAVVDAPPAASKAPVRSVTVAPLRAAPTSESRKTSETAALTAQVARLEQFHAALPDQVRQASGVEELQARYTESVDLLEQMQSVSRAVPVLCPSHGIVGQVRFLPGDQMDADAVMLKILHTDRRHVTVYVPTTLLGDLQTSSAVKIRFPGNSLYTGKVTEIPLIAETVAVGEETLAAIRIEPTGKLWPQLPVGSSVDVIIPE